MTNAELFKQTFDRYATDVWSLPENEFLEWLNADVQQKTGRWIDDKCSVCGKGIEDLIESREWYTNEEPNFCPFCGLKLVDSQESEE